MEQYINNNLSDITYKSELIPPNASKLPKRILMHFTRRDRRAIITFFPAAMRFVVLWRTPKYSSQLRGLIRANNLRRSYELRKLCAH